ncbi:MAG: riboflavin synthase subunit alpha [Oceanospirillaceae bacterium]|nr:riboflavin synthase subunit alpha [Oceanospirillaceae bacterium]MCP5335169.1 riboflavin synthase subunit alpha [Oceanospirillaceae bacterium]MCP5351505.1 riboflavin synthase subunit alpha [Oceanospirillaceae bacterium]
MFTGIVQTTLTIASLEQKPGLSTFALDLPATMLAGLTLGASVALNGTCLTVTKIDGTRVYFDAMAQTLRLTNLGQLKQGDQVNAERAARIGDDIGGHLISGHIAGQVEILAIERPENNCIVWFSIPPQFKAYILDKGYIGLNGCSLTIAEVRDDRFCVYLIPETLRVTLFGTAKAGDKINLEIDSHTQAVVDTVERVLAQRFK